MACILGINGNSACFELEEDRAAEAKTPTTISLTSANERNYTVVTFNPHPKSFLLKRRTLLTPLKEKGQQLLRLGVQQLVLLPLTANWLL